MIELNKYCVVDVDIDGDDEVRYYGPANDETEEIVCEILEVVPELNFFMVTVTTDV